MQGIAQLPAFLLAATLVIVVPGPATLYVAGRARHSARSGFSAVLGIVVGDILLITVSGLGFATLVAQWPRLLDVMKFGGGLYIAYLALELLMPQPSPGQVAHGTPPAGGFAKALLLTLSNPKPILFFSAFFPGFIDHSAPSAMCSFYLLGALFEAINLVYFAALIVLVGRLRQSRHFGSVAGVHLQRLSGIGLLLCSAFVLLS
ncbi:LysE family transporter [Rhodoferax sp. AJA081-3]|uniref:LysE family translocator n=1 Tax=Rhodoferax sp. AJA081-3 TaxID=2752316 RepID=UPI001AE0B96D|nr:LysE family transporter [Rhodoferax sp. AJA081-3]QTN29115.1 LysE family transporter [Rhodoferax sp. AJA081-3]